MRPALNLDLVRELWLSGRTGQLVMVLPGRADSAVGLVRGNLLRGTDPLRVGAAILLGRLRFVPGEPAGEADAASTLRLLVACATELADELEPCCAVTGVLCPTSAGRVGAAHLAAPVACLLRARSTPVEEVVAGGAITRRQLAALHYLGLVRCVDPRELAPVVVEEGAVFHGRGRTAVLQMAANGELHAAEDETGPVPPVTEAAPLPPADTAPPPAEPEPAAEEEPPGFALLDDEEDADEFSVGTIDTGEHTWSASTRQVVELPVAADDRSTGGAASP